MSTIKPLPPEVIAQIAAGEVIQRPENVIKELVENSLDAGAATIHIHLQDVGMKLIEVIDDGVGIEKEELHLALRPHATSKLETLTDFTTLVTRGFRGEALASISLVSSITIASRTKSQNSGYQVSATHGEISDKPKPVGMPTGTKITIEDLFKNSPVRKDFLKKSRTELKRILSVIIDHALINPSVGWHVENNGKVLLTLEKGQTLIQRTREILGESAFSQLIPVEYHSDQMHIQGFISQPSFWHKRREHQYLAINDRPITHKALESRIRSLSQEYQSNKYQPIYSLHIRTSPEFLDVNVHPQKQTIEVFSLVEISNQLRQSIEPLLKSRPLTMTSMEPNLLELRDSGYIAVGKQMRRGLSKEYFHEFASKPELTGPIEQIGRLYLVAPTTKGMIIMDQHALDERIKFDHLSQIYAKKRDKLLKKKVSINQVFDVDVKTASLLEENKAIFEELGIAIESFGYGSYRITEVPQLFADHEMISFVEEVLHQSVDDAEMKLDSQSEKIIASMACRMAIMAGDYVEPAVREQLYQTLMSGNHAGTCPHGRPVSVTISLSELHKLFGRTS